MTERASIEDRPRELLQQVFLLDARESLVVLESGLVRRERPEASPGVGPLLAAAQRLKGTATLLGFAGLAQLARVAAEALEEAATGARGPGPPPGAEVLTTVVPAMRRVVERIAESGEEDPADFATLAPLLSRPPVAGDRVAIGVGGPPPAPGLTPERPGAGPAPPAPEADVPAYFIAEAYERLDAMAGSLDALETDGGDAEALGQLLRSTHSLKGAAYTVGCRAPGDLAHALESLLVAVREDRLSATPAVVDSVRRAIDGLRLLIDVAPQRGEGLPGLVERALGELAAHLPPAPPAASPDGSGARAPADEPKARLEREPGLAVPAGGRLGVRVDVERLDVMLNVIGELLVARGRLDVRLGHLDRATESLAQHRLRMERALQDFDGTTIGPAASRLEPGRGRPTAALFAELELERYDDADVLRRRVGEIRADLAESEGQLAGLMRTVLDDAALIRRLTDRLRDEVIQMRLVPVGRLFPRVVRQIREAARAAGTTVTIELAGESVEVDNMVLEQLADPLLHLARNAVTHGIEPEAERLRQGKPRQGTVRLGVELRGNTVCIQVGDDGRGIDPGQVRTWALRRGLLPAEVARRLSDAEALELVYLPGLSTAPEVTTASGRGVGMDVVRTTVRRLNGEIAMDTAPGVGTTFTMRLPLTLLVSEALMVRVGPDILAIPLHAVQQVLVARPEWIQPTERGETLPLYVETADVIRLDRVLGLSSGAELDRLPVVVVRGSGRPVAVVVTEILEKEAIVVKSLGPFLEGLWPFAGGTISAEGRVILVLDPTRLLQAVGGSAPARPSFVEPLADASTVTPRPRAVEGRRILLVDDSISVRKHIGHMLEQAGFAVVLAADGVEAQERLAEASVDTVITDLEMPRMNGFELIQELRRRPESRELPIVVLTTRAGSKHLNLARWLGANHYVAKPVDESAFVSLIGSLAASSEPAPSPGAAR